MPQAFDAPWRARALAGDPAAVAALAHTELTPLYRFCLYRVGGDHHLCEEVVQETLVRALRDLVLYDPERCAGRIHSWLCGLARNEVRRILTRERRPERLAAWERLDDELLTAYARIESDPLSDAVLQREETRQLVGATMSQLPEPYREVLEAKYVLGQTVRDLAQALGDTEKAVEGRLGRARAAFRATFQALTRTFDVEAIEA